MKKCRIKSSFFIEMIRSYYDVACYCLLLMEEFKHKLLPFLVKFCVVAKVIENLTVKYERYFIGSVLVFFWTMEKCPLHFSWLVVKRVGASYIANKQNFKYLKPKTWKSTKYNSSLSLWTIQHCMAAHSTKGTLTHYW